jgi:GT2 family glycosyltransferase
MKSIDLSIIIVNFNTKDLLRECLMSLANNEYEKYSIEVIVVDNASVDGSMDMVKKEFPSTIIIQNSENTGFAKANNIGIKKSKGRYILLLNSDTEVNHSTIATMLDYMEKNADVGVSTCKLLLRDGSMDPACHRGFPTPWAACAYYLKLEKFFPKSPLFAAYHQTYKNLATIHDVDIISGAFFLVRRSVASSVGVLDEAYFFYGEDMDWCIRIKRAGWRIIYNPTVTILHKKKQSGRANTDKARRVRTDIYFYTYNKLFYEKNYDATYPAWVMKSIYALFDFRLFLLRRFSL